MSRLATLAVAVFAMTPGLCWAMQDAGTAATNPPPSFLGELLAIVVPLALVIVLLLVVLRLARRRFRLTGQDAPLSVLQILPVGPRERLVLVRTRAGEVFAIGVGAQTVTFIREFDPVALGVQATHAESEGGTAIEDGGSRSAQNAPGNADH